MLCIYITYTYIKIYKYINIYIAEPMNSVFLENPNTDSFNKHKLSINSVHALP